jgi:hypothetical protein
MTNPRNLPTDKLREFTFKERCVTTPSYHIRAKDLKEAVTLYVKRVRDGTEGPDEEEVQESYLNVVFEGEGELAESQWRQMVDAAQEWVPRDDETHQCPQEKP